MAGVSGGADSVCLLFMLMEIRRKIPFSLRVVHVNHKIRPQAHLDADYVRALCEKHNIPFFLTEENIKELAREHRRCVEEEGRAVRYQAFEQALEGRPGRIAVAHNGNDRAETMLFHLFRGTGLTGMSGIRPVNGKIIRPLLCLERHEIERWLREREIPFCQDATNDQDIYARNRIRHHILPYAEQEISQGAVSHMCQAADQLLMAESYLCRQTDEALARCVRQDPDRRGRILVELPAFFREEEYLRGRVLLSCLEQAAGGRKNIASTHIRAVEALFRRRGSGQTHLPCGLKVYKEYDVGMIQKRDYEEKASWPVSCQEAGRSFEAPIPGSVCLPGMGRAEFTVFPRNNSQRIPQKTYTKWFDYDKIASVLIFRTKRTGDYLTINRNMGRKSLQDYFVNEKVPRAEREKIFLLAEGSHILWVPGLRISEYYKVDDATRRILQVSFPDQEI